MSTSTSVAWFALAVVMLLAAHLVRCYRQILLFPPKLRPRRFDLLLGLSLGYFINVIVPWRAGDLARICYVAMRFRLRASYVAATVVAERLSDIVVVMLLVRVALDRGIGSEGSLRSLLALLVSATAIILLFAAAVAYSRRFRRLVWRVASIFNDDIKFLLVDLAWSFSQLVTNLSLIRRDYLLLTVLMWATYFGAYGAFAVASSNSFVDVSFTLLGGPNRSLLQQLADRGMSGPALPLFVFTALPLIGVFVYGFLRHHGLLFNTFAGIRRYGFGALTIAQPVPGDRFSEQQDYGAFLASQFTGEKAIVSRFGLIASPEVLIRKLLPGGSDAVTALVEERSVLKIRKCAAAKAGDKLAEQAQWLRDQAVNLPLPDIIGESRTAAAYSYDMPYLVNARDFYEVIHTSPIADSEQVMSEVVSTMQQFHRHTSLGDASDAVVDNYLRQKAIANAQELYTFASVIFSDGSYKINGVDYKLEEWKPLLDLAWLQKQITRREAATVHGDLTVENIIVSPDVERGWYIIDPNPSNVFNTPLIDWAKLMQSLHLGYEGLNRSGQPTLDGKEIKILFQRSHAYSRLHDLLSEQLTERLGVDGMREVAFHEIVNYLRLTPYKIRNQPQKALTFFACISVLLRHYLATELATTLDQASHHRADHPRVDVAAVSVPGMSPPPWPVS